MSWREHLERTRRFLTMLTWAIALVVLPVAGFLSVLPAFLMVVALVVVWHLAVSPLLRILARGADARHDRIEYRITRAGVVTALLCITFLLMAMSWTSNLVYLLTAFLWAMMIVSLIYPRLMLRATNVKAKLPEDVYARTPFAVELRLDNERRVGGAYGLLVGPSDPDRGRPQYVGRLGGRHRSHRLLLRENMPQRGRHWLPGLTVATSFPFGLFRARRVAESERRVLVYPHIGRISAEALAHQRGGEARWLVDQRRKDQQGEFRSLRKYTPGDNPRHIHWATTARMGELFVQEFERREMHSAMLLLDAYMPTDLDEQAAAERRGRFEKAVSFVATLAADLCERGVPFAFASYCPEQAFARHDTGPGHLRDVLEMLALAEMADKKPPVDLQDAVKEHQMRAGGLCLITPGPREQIPQDVLTRSTHSTIIDASSPEFDEFFMAG
jgi:uncharacterized protein (DUF58 family)